MAVEVIFRGVCLFREDERFVASGRRRLHDILIPETKSPTAQRWPMSRHFARLVVLDASGNVVSRHNLDGTNAEIADPMSGPCVLQPSFDSVQEFDRAFQATAAHLKGAASTQKGQARIGAVDLRSGAVRERQDKRTTSRITCVGGAMTALEGSTGWRFAEEKRPARKARPAERKSPAALVSWRSLSGSAVIHIAHASPPATGGTEDGETSVLTSVVLDANHPRAYIYNYDEEWPSVNQLAGYDEGEPRFVRKAKKDSDFRWLYYMVDSGPLFPNREKLAVPVLDQDVRDRHGSRNPGSSAGCFPGRTTVKGT